MTVTILSLVLKIYEAVKTKFNRQQIYMKNMLVYRDSCDRNFRGYEFSMYAIFCYFIAIWVPMILVIIVHIAMYYRLKKQALIRARTSNKDTKGQMQQISKTFILTVIAFFVCLLPLSIINCMIYSPKITPNIYLVGAYQFSIPLANLNSCLNPFIYSRIHKRIFGGMRWLFQKMSRKIGKLGSQSKSQSEETSVDELSTLPSESTNVRKAGS